MDKQPEQKTGKFLGRPFFKREFVNNACSFKARFLLLSLLAIFILFLNSEVVSASAAVETQVKVAQSEQEVSYSGINSVTLAGTLLLPEHLQGKPVPGVVIIAGSGSVDRNGNVVQAGIVSDLYKQLAESLARHGIASLRYDKRGVGASTPFPLPKDPQHPTPEEIAAIQNFAAWSNYVGDAEASLRYLQQQPSIDAQDTALMGHSEGTYIAEQIAASTHQNLAAAPKAVVLLAAPGRPYAVLLREQIGNQLKALQTSDDIIKFVLQQYDAIVTGIEQTGQQPTQPFINLQQNAQVVPAIKTLIFSLFSIYNLKFWQGVLQVKPTELLQQYKGPVLVIQGTSDQNVFFNEDTPLLKEALAKRTHNVSFVELVPHASHFLKHVQDEKTDPGITGPVVPLVLGTLDVWLLWHLYVS